MTDDMSQETVLVLYLNARIELAERELEQGKAWYKLHPGPYTGEKLKWLKHQIAALKIARRDAERPGQIIARYLKERDRQCPDRKSPT